MTEKPTKGGRGGRREGAGRPRGSKTKVYRPHIEKLLSAGGMLPKDIMLAVMRRHFEAQRFDEAARIAAMVAPYIHPRLSAAAITVRPRLSEMSDDELHAFIAEAEAEAGIHHDDGETLAGTQPKGTA